MKARIAKKKLASLVGKTKPVAAKAVQAWINTHFDAQSELFYNRTGVDQACRFRDLFPRCLATSFEEFRECVDVVGEHHSKSVVLPVVRIQANGLTVVIRDNFHDVVMTIIGLREPPRAQVQAFIHRVCSAGFDTKVSFFQGFPPGMQLGPYADNYKAFSIEIPNWIDAYALLRVLGSTQRKTHSR